MAWTEGFRLFGKTRLQVPLKFNGVKGLSANLAADQLQGLKIIPVIALDQVLKFHRVAGADPLAIAATGTAGHVVGKRSPAVLVCTAQGRGRAVLDTGQAAVAPLVYLKVSHN